MPAFGATRDSSEHRGHMKEIDQTKRNLGKPEPAGFVGRTRPDNQPRRPRPDRAQGEDPTELQVHTVINQRPFETRKGRRVIWIDRVTAVGMPDRPVHNRLASINRIYPEVRREIGAVRNDVADLGMLPLRKDHVAAHILDPPDGPVERFARVPTPSTETHLGNPRPHLFGRGVDRRRSGPLNLWVSQHIVTRQRPR